MLFIYLLQQDILLLSIMILVVASLGKYKSLSEAAVE